MGQRKAKKGASDVAQSLGHSTGSSNCRQICCAPNVCKWMRTFSNTFHLFSGLFRPRAKKRKELNPKTETNSSAEAPVRAPLTRRAWTRINHATAMWRRTNGIRMRATTRIRRVWASPICTSCSRRTWMTRPRVASLWVPWNALKQVSEMGKSSKIPTILSI